MDENEPNEKKTRTSQTSFVRRLCLARGGGGAKDIEVTLVAMIRQ
jgi:hypothetical protein